MAGWFMRASVLAALVCCGCAVGWSIEYPGAGGNWNATVNLNANPLDWTDGDDVLVNSGNGNYLTGDNTLTVIGGSKAMGDITVSSYPTAPGTGSGNVSSDFIATAAAIDITFSDATITGSNSRTAILNVVGASAGNTEVSVENATVLERNARLFLNNTSSSSVIYNTGSLVFGGGSGPNTYVSITGNDSNTTRLTAETLTMSGNAGDALTIAGGELALTGTGSTVSKGMILFNSGTLSVRDLTLDSVDAQFAVQTTGTKELRFTGADAEIELTNGALMNVVGTVVATGTGTIRNTSGRLEILSAFNGDGTTIRSASTTNINADTTVDILSVEGGTTTIGAAATATVDTAVDVSGGTLDVDGTLAVETAMNATGGVVNVDGTVRGAAATATIGGATVNINGGASATFAQYNQTSGATNIVANGVLAANASMGVSGGSLTVEGTDADNIGAVTAGSATVSGNAEVDIDGFGRFTATTYEQTGGTVTVATGGALVAIADLGVSGGSLTVEGTDADNYGAVTAGAAAISGTAEVDVDRFGRFTAATYEQTGGTTTVAVGGALVATSALGVSGGTLAVNGADADNYGSVTADKAAVSGTAIVNINKFSHFTATTYEQTGGEVTVEADGLLTSTDLVLEDGVTTVSGTVNAVNAVSSSDGVTIKSDGKIVATTGFTVADGKVTVEARGVLDVTDGRLTVSGGVLDLTGKATATDMTFSGGETNVRAGESLTIANAVRNARGTLHMYGGSAIFEAGIEFAAGGIVSHDPASVIESTLVTIGENAMLDASRADMYIEGDLVLGGTYAVDYVSGTVNMVNLLGALDVRQTVKVEFSQAMVDYVMDQGGAVRILASEGLMDGVAAGNLPNAYRYNVYAYYLSLVDDAGNSGLYIDRMRILELDELRRYMIDDWNQHRDVRGYAENLINGDLVNAVLKGSLDYSDPDVKLSYAGAENAHNLFNIGEGPVNSSYSALMLYNGSGLAMVNQTHLATGGQMLDVLGGRMGLLRNGPTSIATCEDAFGNRMLEPADRFGNRIWASGFGSEQSLKWKDGFAGYKYRPYGVSVGFDRDFGDLVLGVAASYVNGKYEDHAAEKNDSRISALSGSLYGMYRHRETGLFLGGSVGIVRFDNDLCDMRTMRNNADALSRGWNSADYNASGWLAHGRLGYDLRFGGNLIVTPSVGVRHVYAESDSHRQNFRPLDGSAEYNTLVAGKVDNHSTTVPFELSFNYNFIGEEDAVLSVFGSVGYAYELNEDAAQGSVTYGGLSAYPAVAIAGRAADRDVLMAGLGMNYIYDRYEFSVDYRLTARDKYYTHYVNGLVSVKF